MKKLYFKVYQSKNDTNKDNSYFIEKIENILNSYGFEKYEDFLELESGVDLPVLEPIFLTEEEFNDLPEFTGF